MILRFHLGILIGRSEARNGTDDGITYAPEGGNESVIPNCDNL
jgi:hypothetical protein